jgi:hypothetical protein
MTSPLGAVTAPRYNSFLHRWLQSCHSSTWSSISTKRTSDVVFSTRILAPPPINTVDGAKTTCNVQSTAMDCGVECHGRIGAGGPRTSPLSVEVAPAYSPISVWASSASQ